MSETPKAGEWWRSNDETENGFICGFDHEGDPVVEIGGMVDHYEISTFMSWWHHEPRCTGFDWVEPPAEVWPKYYRGDRWSDADAYVRFDDAESLAVWVGNDGSELRHKGHVYAEVENAKLDYQWRELTEAEALARVKPPVAPLPALVPGIPTDRMVDLFLSWRLPSDFMPDGGISFTERPIHENWPTGTNLFTSSQARKMLEYVLSVPEDTERVKPPEHPIMACPDCGEFRGHGHECEHDDVPHRSLEGTKVGTLKLTPVKSMDLSDNPVDSPDDWVEITDTHPGHVRRLCDQVCGKIEDPDNWYNVGWTVGYSQHAYPMSRIRCRRKDLPVPMTLQSVAEVCTTDPGPSPTSKAIDVNPGDGWRWVERDEPWQLGDDCLICDGTYPHTHNCQGWRRRIEPSPERIPDNRPARDVIIDIVQWLDPHPPALSKPEEALDCAEQWLIDNPVNEAGKRVPVRLWVFGKITSDHRFCAVTSKTEMEKGWQEILHDADGWFVEVAE